MIKLNNVDLYFGANRLFEDCSFEIKRGSKACISGPSGKGKSSLLRLIQGFLIPASGSVEIEGVALSENSINKIREKISWVPQNIDLPIESAEELLELLRIEKENQSYLVELLMELGLDESFLYREFKEISGGQKQRIVLAVCIAQKRPILILDEPTSSLDEMAIHKLINVVNTLTDVTVVSTSHNENWLKSASQIIQL